MNNLHCLWLHMEAILALRRLGGCATQQLAFNLTVDPLGHWEPFERASDGVALSAVGIVLLHLLNRNERGFRPGPHHTRIVVRRRRQELTMLLLLLSERPGLSGVRREHSLLAWILSTLGSKAHSRRREELAASCTPYVPIALLVLQKWRQRSL